MLATLRLDRMATDPPPLLTLQEVAKLLHAHPNSVRRWADFGLLRCYRVGVRRDRRFDQQDLERYLREVGRANGKNS